MLSLCDVVSGKCTSYINCSERYINTYDGSHFEDKAYNTPPGPRILLNYQPLGVNPHHHSNADKAIPGKGALTQS